MTVSRQYPPPTGPYKVCIVQNADWHDVSSCRIQVSVGNQKYEGAKWLALTEWCTARFDRTTIILSDTLQRHNLATSPALAWDISRHEGDKWLARNRSAFPVIRWDELLSDPRYPAARQRVNRIAESGEFLREELAVFSFLLDGDAVNIYAGSWIVEPLYRIGLTPRRIAVDFVKNRAFAPDHLAQRAA